MLDGRVKTLHPKVHAGILARRDLPAHMQAMARAAIPTIDIVVVNLYPFAQTIAKPDCTLEEAIENIDIGGPTMVRAAAKNYQHVAIVTDPQDYGERAGGADGLWRRTEPRHAAAPGTQSLLAYCGLRQRHQQLSHGRRRRRAAHRVSRSSSISTTPRSRICATERTRTRRAAFYRDLQRVPGALSNYVQLQGKELSYNNIADADAAWECVKTLRRPGLRDRQARQSLRGSGGCEHAAPPTSARFQPIRPRPSAASSPSTANWTPPLPRR